MQQAPKVLWIPGEKDDGVARNADSTAREALAESIHIQEIHSPLLVRRASFRGPCMQDLHDQAADDEEEENSPVLQRLERVKMGFVGKDKLRRHRRALLDQRWH